MSDTPRLFIFGLGYSAQTLARRLLARGWRVAGTTRDGTAPIEGVEAWRFDREHPLADPDTALAGTTHLLSSVPPDDQGDPVLDTHGATIRALAPAVQWAGYLSTTGVYGNHDGAWVDETTPPAPDLDRSRKRLAAEEAWRATRLPLDIFRLAGIYGPGRSAIDQVRAGRARRIVKPGQVFCRIHVADVANALEHAMVGRGGSLYNVCDDEPAPPQDVIAEAARLLGVEPPPETPFGEAALSPMAASFYADNKRVANTRLKDGLGVHLHYPDYRAGLAAILDGERP